MLMGKAKGMLSGLYLIKSYNCMAFIDIKVDVTVQVVTTSEM